MMRYGIPGYRTPRERLDREIQRILDLGEIELKLGTRVGRDLSIEQLEADHDAILWAVGCQTGRRLPVPGADAPNCVSGVQFLEAFNTGRLKIGAGRVVCVGGGDTSIDVVSVARRLGHIRTLNPQDRPELVVHGFVAHDAATAAVRTGADVTLTSLLPREAMTAAQREVQDALQEGVAIIDGVMPIEVVLDEQGRARALRMCECDWVDNAPAPREGTEFELEADLVVAAIGQGGDLSGIDELDNGRGFIDADKTYRVPQRPGHFVAGDIVRPNLLTNAIGQASIAAAGIDHYLNGDEPTRRPKVDVHHFNLLQKLRESGLGPGEYDHRAEWGTCDADYSIHNYEDRSTHEVVPADELFLAHFEARARHKRPEKVPDAEAVLGHFEERTECLPEAEAVAEADRCMSCGMCFECDNCVIFCPQDAVFRVKKDQRTLGRYVDTDYARCIGCHICADVCPSGYIDMGMGK